jgi:hypothetical protein
MFDINGFVKYMFVWLWFWLNDYNDENEFELEEYEMNWQDL